MRDTLWYLYIKDHPYLIPKTSDAHSSQYIHTLAATEPMWHGHQFNTHEANKSFEHRMKYKHMR